MYQPPSFTTRLTLLAVVVSAASAIPLQHPQHPSFFHIQTGPITFHIYSPPLTPPPEPSLDARLSRGTSALIVIAVLLFQYVLYTILRWLRSHLSPVEHGQRVVPAGRSSAVSLGNQPRPPSLTRLYALSVGAIASGGVLPPPEAALPAEFTTPKHQALSVASTESNSSRNVDPPNETSSLVANSYTPCTYHPLGHEPAPTAEAGTQRSPSNVNDTYPEAHQASTGKPSASGSTEATPRDGEASPSSSPLALNKSFGRGIVSYIISSILLTAFVLDWGGALPGVALDLKWLDRTCTGSEHFITFNALTQVTREIIRLKILQMFNDARLGTAIVLYFNGHGWGNSFLLYDGNGSVDAAALTGWITAIRAKTGKRNHVYIVFEHCRIESPGPLSLDLGQDIHIIYACAPGQRSADFKMAGDDDAYIPCSNFLKAFCLVLAEARARPIVSVGHLMSRMNVWMEKVVRMMRAEECRMSECPSPCVVCPCPSYKSCVHRVTRARHGVEEAYPRNQNPDATFLCIEVHVPTNELLELPNPAAEPFLDRIQETAERIKGHEIYRLLDNRDSYTWLALCLTLWSMAVSVLNSVLRFLAPNRAEPAVGSVPCPTGLGGESSLFQPSAIPVQRGRDVGTAAIPAFPLPL